MQHQQNISIWITPTLKAIYHNRTIFIGPFLCIIFFFKLGYNPGNGLTSQVDVSFDYNEILKCGTIRDDWTYDAANRKKAPKTKMYETGTTTAEYFDVPVDKNGYCTVYPCPLAVKIRFIKNENQQFNGYYVLNFPSAYEDSITKINFRVFYFILKYFFYIKTFFRIFRNRLPS